MNRFMCISLSHTLALHQSEREKDKERACVREREIDSERASEREMESERARERERERERDLNGRVGLEELFFNVASRHVDPNYPCSCPCE